MLKKVNIAQYYLKENVEYTLRDKDGNIKQLFTDNKLGELLLKFTRKFIKEPIDEAGQVKKGILNYLATYGLRVPLLTGSWGNSRVISNLITNAGFAGAASRLNGSGAVNIFVNIAVGTGTTAANVADTTLQTETAASGLSRAAGTASRVTTTQTNDTAQAVITFTVTGTVAVTESGLLSELAAGVLLCRQVFSAINVVNGDSLQITWKIKCA